MYLGPAVLGYRIYLFYQSTPPPLRNIAIDFQINMMNVNKLQIQTISDTKVDDFWDKNLAIVCGKQEFPPHWCGNKSVSSDTPPGNQVCQREA